jgi:hypothetical protein
LRDFDRTGFPSGVCVSVEVEPAMSSDCEDALKSAWDQPTEVLGDMVDPGLEVKSDDAYEEFEMTLSGRARRPRSAGSGRNVIEVGRAVGGEESSPTFAAA